MLYTIDGKKVTVVPHYENYLSYSKRMNKSDMEKITDYLRDIIDKEEVLNSSYIPPKHWKGSVFYPIYETIKDNQLSAYFYGQILWKLVMEDDRKWMFQQSDDTLGKIYFLVKDTEKLKD